jgi:ketosteroid isomerase-like protein
MPQLPEVSGARAVIAAVILAAAATVACATGPGGDARADSAAVLAADRARTEAMVAADPTGLDATLHPSLTYTHSNGKLDTKASLVASLLDGGIDYLSIETLAPQVRVRGDTAVLTSHVRIRVEAALRVHDLEMAVIAVYWKDDGRWQLAAYQSVRVGD